VAQPKILLVDDDSQFLYLVQRYADASGWTLIYANGANQAKSFALQENPDIILIDIGPVPSEKLTTLHFLKTDPATSQIPVYLCSASESAISGWEEEADGCLIKPVMYEDFKKILANVTIEPEKRD
jgi:DNA-binding response OmpR family regulator